MLWTTLLLSLVLNQNQSIVEGPVSSIKTLREGLVQVVINKTPYYIPSTSVVERDGKPAIFPRYEYKGGLRSKLTLNKDRYNEVEKAEFFAIKMLTPTQYPPMPPMPKPNSGIVEDALPEVNERRAKRGLKPFVNDDGLRQAALSCAKIRAQNHIHGHLSGNMGDFAYLPSGCNASAAGCGALEPSWGWGTCCMDDNYTYGGAAMVIGNDGLRYMHLFVRR